MVDRRDKFLDRVKIARDNDVYMCVFDQDKTMEITPHIFYHHPDYIFCPTYRLYGDLRQVQNALDDYEVDYTTKQLQEESFNNRNMPLDLNRYYIERIEHLKVIPSNQRVMTQPVQQQTRESKISKINSNRTLTKITGGQPTVPGLINNRLRSLNR